MTRQRTAILAAVRATDVHPTADWVYREVKKRLPSVSLSTVYRNLDCLVKHGELVALPDDARTLRYDGNLRSHAHIVCACCGQIADADPPDHERWLRELGLHCGFHLSELRIEARGICESCVGAR